MSEHYLNRGDAPFQEKTWEAIDGAVIGAARSQLSARRLLSVEGPYGLGLKSVPLGDETIEGESAEGVTLSGGGVLPLLAIQATFCLAARDIAAFEERGAAMDLGAAVNAAIACAKQEDALLFNGVKSASVEGLLNVKGAQSARLKSWESVGAAADDLIAAVTKLDAAGFHGPYTLALAPDRFNLLYRRYPQGNQTELDHLASVVTEGIVKAPAIKSGGVLLAAGAQFARIVLGQDMAAGFVGPDGTCYELTVSESIALRIMAPASVLVLK
jgi:uncharacterized linocin/CFP29 family protein